MDLRFTRRQMLQTALVPCLTALQPASVAEAGPLSHPAPGWVTGKLTGAQALVDTLLAEGVECVYGIPGAQENELWDTFKARGLGYLLVTHEFSAACMADGYARSTGKPGVLCVVPGPGVTNSLSGIGEALLDSVPLVAIVGDIARGEKYKPFQVHDLPQVELLRPMTKGVFEVRCVQEIPQAVRQAFQLAMCGEPGPTAVVVPWPLFIESHQFNDPPLGPPPLSFDEHAFQAALALLADRKRRIGIYAGQGCMNYGAQLTQVAELLQAPVATSVSGKGCINECHPLAVGWGYGPQGTLTAEEAFRKVDTVLALGVKYSEVSTAFYNIPKKPHVIHVDANPNNLGRIVKTDVCVHADAGLFLERLLAQQPIVCRPPNDDLVRVIKRMKYEAHQSHQKIYSKDAVDPMAFVLALRRCTSSDALVFVDVTMTEHWAAEAFTVVQPRTYFNPTDNQAMGWSIPAALGAQRVHPGRQVVTITGDGCFLMSAMEITTAARAGLPVKFFLLDDQAYHYMQALQKPAYRRTTATILARLDYAALAQGFGVGYQEIICNQELDAAIQGVLCRPGPVLVRVVVDYGKRPVRWIEATSERFIDELTVKQQARFAARIGTRSLHVSPRND